MVATLNVKKVTLKDLLEYCGDPTSNHFQKGWEEFYRRYHPFAARQILDQLKTYDSNVLNAENAHEIIRDIQAEFYVVLSRNDCRVLQGFKAPDDENQFYVFLSNIAETVTNYYLEKYWPTSPQSNETIGGSHLQSKESLIAQASNEVIRLPRPSIVLVENWAEIIKAIGHQQEILYKLHWRKFEDLIAHLLESNGWSVTPMGYTKDNGIDIIAARIVKPDIRFDMLVQCKRYSKARRIGVDYVREVWAVKWENGFHQAMIATTSTFTKGAKRKSAKWNLELKDNDAIVEWCRQYQYTLNRQKRRHD